LNDSHWSEQNVRRLLLSPIAPVSWHLSSTRLLYKWCALIKLLLTGPGIADREAPAQPYHRDVYHGWVMVVLWVPNDVTWSAIVVHTYWRLCGHTLYRSSWIQYISAYLATNSAVAV
jgi:hypothetical protein